MGGGEGRLSRLRASPSANGVVTIIIVGFVRPARCSAPPAFWRPLSAIRRPPVQTLKTAAVPIVLVVVVVACVLPVPVCCLCLCVAVVAFSERRHKNCLFIFAATANFIIIFVLDNDSRGVGAKGARGGEGRGRVGVVSAQPNGSLVVSCLF